MSKSKTRLTIFVFQNNVNNLSTSNTDEGSVSQQLPHSSNVIKALPPASSASDLSDRTQSSLTVPRTCVSQHNDISHISKPASVTAVNNSPNILKSVTPTVSLNKSSVSAGQVAQIHIPVEGRTHEKDSQNNQFKSSDNTYVNFLPSLSSTMNQSIPSNNNNLHHHKLEDRLSSSLNILGAKENTHSSTIVQDKLETNTSEKVQEKCQAILAKEPLCSAVVGHVAKDISKMNPSVCPLNSNCKPSETQSVNKLDSTLSHIVDRTRDCGIELYNKENTSQQPHPHNLTHVGKPFRNTKNCTQICSSENKEHNLVHGQVAVQDAGSRPLYNSEYVMHTKGILSLPAQNGKNTVEVATGNLEDQICQKTAVENAALPSIKVASPCDITALHNIPQQKSDVPCTHPSPPLVPVTESWKLSHGVHSYVPNSANAFDNVNSKNAPLVSGLVHSYDKECYATEMRVAAEQLVSSIIPATSTYTTEENHSLTKQSTPNIHSSIITTKSISQGKPSPTIADIPASISKILLNPLEVSEIVRAIGSELGVFLENDDTVGNIAQAPEYSASGMRVTTEYSNPQLRRNITTSDQTSGPAMLQAQRNMTSTTGQSIHIPLSHRDINKQPQTAFILPQQQFPQFMTSVNYICTAPNCMPNDYQRIISRRVTPVKHTKHRKRRPEEEYSATPKRRKCGLGSKSCASRQRTKRTKCEYLLEDNLRSLPTSVKAAFPDMKISNQEEFQTTVINPYQENELGLSEIRRLTMLTTSKRSGKKMQSTEASGVGKEAEQHDTLPEVLAAEINTERLNILHSLRIKIVKTNGKYRSSSPQKYSKFVCQDAQDLSSPENRQTENAACDYRPHIRISQLKPYQLAPFVVVKRLNKFFVPNVSYRLTDVNVINLLDKM